MLTGKCEIEFEKWLKNQNFEECNISDEYSFQPNYIGDFERLPFSMQYGVYVDFFDSVGFFIDVSTEYEYTRDEFQNIDGEWINPHYMPDKWYYNIHNKSEFLSVEGGFNKCHEARTKAIEKANEIYNQNKDESN